MATKEASKPKKEISSLSKSYLIAYNGTLTLGWIYLLLKSTIHFLDRGSLDTFWPVVDWIIILFQSAAILEVVHAAVGLVPSGIFLTLMQVYSRLFVVWGVLVPTAAAKVSPGLVLCVLAWSITEIVRYSYYLTNLLGSVPEGLLKARYTLFIVLYPLGITGELLCMYHAQEEVAETNLWSTTMPNSWNVIFNYRIYLIGYMFSYIPFFPVLYGHMWMQRKKVLGQRPINGDKLK